MLTIANSSLAKEAEGCCGLPSGLKQLSVAEKQLSGAIRNAEPCMIAKNGHGDGPV